MCLQTLKSYEERNRFCNRAADKNGYITAYKIVSMMAYKGGAGELVYVSWSMKHRFARGLNEVKSAGGHMLTSNPDPMKQRSYPTGFHFYLNKKAIRKQLRVHVDACREHSSIKTLRPAYIIKCKIHKSWVLSLGTECYLTDREQMNTIVTDKAYIPSPENKKAIVEILE